MDIKQIKGIIFDIDGVLLDSMVIWNNLGAKYLISQDKEPEPGLNDILFSMSLEQGADYLRDHYLPDMTREEIIKGIEDMLDNFYYHEVQAKPGVKDLLALLQASGLRITAATSSPRSHVERALERNGLLPYIEAIYTNSEVGVSKHSPEIYDRAAGFMGLPRAACLVFEDSLYALRTAKEAGYPTVGVYDQYGESRQKELEETADIYIKDSGKSGAPLFVAIQKEMLRKNMKKGELL